MKVEELEDALSVISNALTAAGYEGDGDEDLSELISIVLRHAEKDPARSDGQRDAVALVRAWCQTIPSRI